MPTLTLRADCAHCAALCCVALAFDRSELFAFDKKAGEPCPNLSACGTCRIHAKRKEEGFSGCIGYDCAGAGQYVTEIFFAGRSWAEEPALLAPMMEAFAIVRDAHTLILALRRVGTWPVPEAAREKCATLAEALAPGEEWSAHERERLLALAREARRLLRSLKGSTGVTLARQTGRGDP